MRASISEVEKSLWEAADQLRANSKLTATEYSMPVLGLIFLRFACNRFLMVKNKIEAGLPSHPERGQRKITKQDFLSEKAIFLPEKSRFDYLATLPDGTNLGDSINEAMKAVEEEYPNLAGVLPRNYNQFEDSLLRDLLRIFDRDSIRNIEGDAFGKIYEYFLNEFAITGAQEGGEFFTPSSLVNTIVNVIKPDHGIILDPACGSAGMFVQTGHFIEEEGFNPGEKITIYGQEKTTTNTRIAKMNLAVHGLEGKIAEVNTFYNDEFDLAGKCDFVMANPPFNVDGVDKGREFVKNDPRLLYTIDEGGSRVRLLPKNDNANYLWIQYFYGYLNENGRAGFVMAASASDAGYSEKDIRERLVKTGAVDVMIAIGTNFFYTRSLPCTLWFFDRSKENDKVAKNRTLMLDARSIFRVVTRKINDFSPEQLHNIAAIVGLYRGDRKMYTELIEKYFKKCQNIFQRIKFEAEQLSETYLILHHKMITFYRENQPFSDEFGMLENLKSTCAHEFIGYEEELENIQKSQTRLNREDISALNSIQKDLLELYQEALAPLIKYQMHTEELIKEQKDLAEKIVGYNKEKLESNKPPKEWQPAEIRKNVQAIDESKIIVHSSIKESLYFLDQIKWLQSRFPEATYNDVEGLCRVVTIQDIAANDYSLTPGRYVGVVQNEGDQTDFKLRLRQIANELINLNDEANELAKIISSDLEELGI